MEAKSVTLVTKEVRLLPIGDIQFGAPGCDIDRLERHIAWGMEQDCYFVGMGDYLDVMSPSNRRKWAEVNAALYDSVRLAFDEKMASEEEKLERIVAPTKGRWFGLISGHHYYPFLDGTTSVSRLAAFLDCPELGDCATVTLKLKERKNGPSCPIIIWLHHGAGSSQMAGGMLNKIEHVSKRTFAHVYLMGHQHAKPVVPIPFVETTVDDEGNPVQHSVNRYLVGTGGFLKGYEMGTKDPMGHPAGSYIEKD